MMKNKVISAVVFLMVLVLSNAQNPIIQTMYTADPAPMVYNGKLYLYTSHDEDNSSWFVMNNWKLYSTTDMVNWTDHGVVLSYSDFSWAKGDAWAAQCIERDGKFYMYVPVTSRLNNRPAIGVAVADSPYDLSTIRSENRWCKAVTVILTPPYSLTMTDKRTSTGEIRTATTWS